MEEHEIEELIDEQKICRIVFKGGEYPYLAPFLYVVRDGSCISTSPTTGKR